MERGLSNEEDEMSCVICRNGITPSGAVTVALQRAETTVILKNVPANVCENCGEYYLSSEIAAQVLEKAESAVKSGAEVEILRFAARGFGWDAGIRTPIRSSRGCSLTVRRRPNKTETPFYQTGRPESTDLHSRLEVDDDELVAGERPAWPVRLGRLGSRLESA